VAVFAVAVVLVAGPAAIGALVLSLEAGLELEELGEKAGFPEKRVVGEHLKFDDACLGVSGPKLFDFGGEEVFLVEAGAAEAPLGIGHFADVAEFGEVVGTEVIDEFGVEGVVVGGVVAGEEHGLGAEAVAEVVLGGAGLPGGGGGSGGLQGVRLIGADLGSGSHKESPGKSG
jgi:hypothetical protein